MKKQLSLALMAIACACNTGTTPSIGTNQSSANYEQAKIQEQAQKITIEQYESTNFKEFLILSDATLTPVYKEVRKGLFRKENQLQGWQLIGKIANKATKVDFTEVGVKLSFYNQDKVLVKSETVGLPNIYEHGFEKPFAVNINSEPYSSGTFSAELIYASEADYH